MAGARRQALLPIHTEAWPTARTAFILAVAPVAAGCRTPVATMPAQAQTTP